jgi:CBS domain containing-hemolysin-like protein
MTRSRSYLDIALASLKVFSDDGRLDLDELEGLMSLALRDNAIDVDERAVLANVFRRAERSVLSPEVCVRIAEVRAKHEVPR